MGETLGPCRRCGKLMIQPHPTGLCRECREKSGLRAPPDNPDIPEPLRFEK